MMGSTEYSFSLLIVKFNFVNVKNVKLSVTKTLTFLYVTLIASILILFFYTSFLILSVMLVSLLRKVEIQTETFKH